MNNTNDPMEKGTDWVKNKAGEAGETVEGKARDVLDDEPEDEENKW